MTRATKHVPSASAIAAALFAFVLALPFGAVTHAYAQKGASAKNATAGMSRAEPARTVRDHRASRVRDHRGPYGTPSGGVKVDTDCTYRTYKSVGCQFVRDHRKK